MTFPEIVFLSIGLPDRCAIIERPDLHPAIQAGAKVGGWIVGIGAAIATAYYTMRLSIHK